MRKITRKIVAAAITTALMIPGVSEEATAQSSFGSSSSDSGTPTTGGSKSVKLERAFEQALIAQGQILSPTAEKRAENLLNRALNHELPFVYNQYESIELNPLTQVAAFRFTLEEADFALQNLESGFVPDFGDLSGTSIPFGVAVGKDSEYYYVTLALIVG